MVEDKKMAVLRAAEYLFSTRGFNETTVADISKESGIHEASIYSYFNNKRNILFTIQGNYLQMAIEALNEHFQGMKEPGPKLRKAIWHYLADIKNHPHYARTLMMAQRENPEFYSSEQVRYVKQYSGLILQIVIAGQEEGFFRKDINPRLIRNMAMGTSVYAAFDCIINESPFDPNDMSDIIYQLVLDATGDGTPVSEKSLKIQKSERTELRRNQIMEHAVQIFANKGFSSATIAEVAREANLGDATLYEYFENKEAILLGISETYLRNLASDEDIRFKGLSNPEKALRKLIWHWIWHLYTNENFARILVLDLFRNLHFYSSPGYQLITTFWEKIRNVIRQGQGEGIFRGNVPFRTYCHMITGTLDQFLLSQFLLKRPPLGISELTDMVNAFVRAVKVREQ
ncbi:MAG: TetR/AcrR family transcriptional regulator [Deltaproteobacteria bacterium]|nr:TetR/AcrR family transcriptional regulator [Deltaproteobacteria bacterium]